MLEMVVIMIPIASFIMVFGIVYIERTASNRERMSLIEKGFSPEEIKKLEKNNEATLVNGFLFVGAAIGLLIGYWLTTISGINNVLAYIACAFLFGGIGIIIGNVIDKSK